MSTFTVNHRPSFFAPSDLIFYLPLHERNTVLEGQQPDPLEEFVTNRFIFPEATTFEKDATFAYLRNVESQNFLKIENFDYFPTSSDFTLEFWMYLDSTLTGTSDSIIMATEEVMSSNRVYIYSNTSFGSANNQFRVWSSTDGEVLVGSDHRNDTWVHISIVRSGSSFTLYEDGLEVDTTTSSDPFHCQMIYVFSTEADPARTHLGGIKEIRIWNVARTQQEIQDQKDVLLFDGIEFFESEISGTSYTITGLDPETEYVWRVKEDDTDSSSEFSNFETFTTLEEGGGGGTIVDGVSNENSTFTVTFSAKVLSSAEVQEGVNVTETLSPLAFMDAIISESFTTTDVQKALRQMTASISETMASADASAKNSTTLSNYVETLNVSDSQKTQLTAIASVLDGITNQEEWASSLIKTAQTVDGVVTESFFSGEVEKILYGMLTENSETKDTFLATLFSRIFQDEKVTTQDSTEAVAIRETSISQIEFMNNVIDAFKRIDGSVFEEQSMTEVFIGTLSSHASMTEVFSFNEATQAQLQSKINMEFAQVLSDSLSAVKQTLNNVKHQQTLSNKVDSFANMTGFVYEHQTVSNTLKDIVSINAYVMESFTISDQYEGRSLVASFVDLVLSIKLYMDSESDLHQSVEAELSEVHQKVHTDREIKKTDIRNYPNYSAQDDYGPHGFEY